MATYGIPAVSLRLWIKNEGEQIYTLERYIDRFFPLKSFSRRRFFKEALLDTTISDLLASK